MATIFASYGYMMVWVPEQQRHEAKDINAIVCMILMSVLNFPQRQGLTLVHFSAQLKPCLKQENTLHTLNTP